VTGKAGLFEGNTLLKASITTESNHVMVNDGVARSVEASRVEFSSGCESDGVTDTGTEGSSGGLNTGGGVLGRGELGVARGHGIEAAEVLDLLKGQSISREMQPRVQEHRSVTSRKDEAISVEPKGVLGVVGEVVAPKLGTNLSAAKRKTQMARVASRDGIQGKTTSITSSRLESNFDRDVSCSHGDAGGGGSGHARDGGSTVVK